MFILDQYLETMVSNSASDIFITVNYPVSAKINGQLTPLDEQILSADDALELVHQAMTEKQKEEFANNKECNFAIARDGIGRSVAVHSGNVIWLAWLCVE